MAKKFLSKFLIFSLAALTAVFLFSYVEANSRHTIRVLIFRDICQLKIGGSRLSLTELPSGRQLVKNKNAFTIIREKGHLLRLQGKEIRASVFALTSEYGYFFISGKRYKGKIMVYPANNKEIWAVNELPVEDYLVGLVNREISSQWPKEAVKAQIVAARTYALFQKEKRAAHLYDLEATVNDQVYDGISFEDEIARRAVKETEGEIILYRGKPIFAVYHACCGGRTESPAYIWTGDYPYLQSVPCGFCLDSPHFIWSYQINVDKLEKILQKRFPSNHSLEEIEEGPRNESKRIIKITVKRRGDNLEIPASEFRQLLGYDQLRSTNFWVKKVNRTFSFSGIGWGHGVGLCQWGAKGMADTGAEYQSIIKYYYQNVGIGKKMQ